MINKRVIILSSIILLCLAAVFALFLLLPNNTEDSDALPTAPPYDKTLVDIHLDDITRLEVSPREGKAYSIRVNSDDNGYYYTLTPPQMGYEYEPGRLERVVDYAASITDARLLRDDAGSGDLTAYGFDNPIVIKINGSDGLLASLELGTQTPDGEWYMRRAGESEIYIVKAYPGTQLSMREQDLRLLNFMPVYSEENPITSELETLILDYPEQTLAFEHVGDKESEILETSAGLGSFFRMLSPYDYYASDEMLYEYILTPLTEMSFGKSIEDYPKDLAFYGLDKPYRISFTDKSGAGGTLLIGRALSESEISVYSGADGDRFAMVDGKNSVVTLHSEFSFLNLRPIDYVYKLIWLENIADVKQVRFETPDGVRVLDLNEHEDAEGATVLNATLDGVPMDESDARRLYTRMLGMRIADNNSGVVVPEEEFDWRITMTKADGTVRTLEAYYVNDRQYGVILDGKNFGFLMNIKSLRDVSDAFNLLDSGGHLDINF